MLIASILGQWRQLPRRAPLLRLALTAMLLLPQACAQAPTDPEERADFVRRNDPLEPMNRKIFAFNTFVDDHLMEPVARAYHDTLPNGVQKGVHNVLTNLNEPYVGGNEILQGKAHAAADDLGRFLINSTFGVLGIWDVAAGNGGPKGNDTDIGLTLGTWGIGEGPFLMLPFFGPSNPRDGIGLLANFWADPVDAVINIPPGTNWAVDTRFGFNLVDTRVQLLEPVADLKRTALDYYASVRSLYRQRRRSALGISQPSAGTSQSEGPGDLP